MRRPELGVVPMDATQLRIHPRKRLALLEEIGADVDAMEDELASRGLPRGKARSAAIARLYPGPEVAQDLELDQAAYRRLAHRFGQDRIERAERVALGLVALLTAATVARPVLSMDWYGIGGMAALLVVLTISLLVGNTLRVAYGLWIRHDLGARQRRSAWYIQTGLILIAISISGAGAAAEMYEVAGRFAEQFSWSEGLALVSDVMVLVGLGLGAILVGITGWLALTPSLRSYEAFERRLGGAFIPMGPRLVGESSTADSGRQTPCGPEGIVPVPHANTGESTR